MVQYSLGGAGSIAIFWFHIQTQFYLMKEDQLTLLAEPTYSFTSCRRTSLPSWRSRLDTTPGQLGVQFYLM